MRINQYVARSTGLSRRSADTAIARGRVMVDGHVARLGQEITDTSRVTLDGSAITPDVKTVTIMLNKPAGYVCSRVGQGSKTIYDLLPPELHQLKPVGRLDKDSSGLLLLTNDGNLANELTHPSSNKSKQYQVKLDRELAPADEAAIKKGVKLADGMSRLGLAGSNYDWLITMSEGRNRQIRRTFAARGYTVVTLHRVRIDKYELGEVSSGKFIIL